MEVNGCLQKCMYTMESSFCINNESEGCISLTEDGLNQHCGIYHGFGMAFDGDNKFPPLGWSISQKGVQKYFEDYSTFQYKADAQLQKA